MKGRVWGMIVFLLFIIFSLLYPLKAQAQHVINYQGYLTDSSGNPVDYPSGIQMRFSLWSDATGGTELWSEIQVVVNQGIYSVLLGSVSALSLDFTQTYYLQVEIDDGAGGWESFSGRLRLTDVPYAINADTVDGRDASELDQSAHVSDTSNPHHVTAAQTGAVTQADFNSHTGNPDAHHSRYTDSEAVSAVKAADGAGSGLDADLLDGKDSTHFASATDVAALQATVSTLQSQIADLQSQVAVGNNQNEAKNNNDCLP
jgi:hypothetical protein